MSNTLESSGQNKVPNGSVTNISADQQVRLKAKQAMRRLEQEVLSR